MAKTRRHRDAQDTMETLKNIRDEGGGVWQVRIVPLTQANIAACPPRMLPAIEQFLANAYTTPEPLLCLTCDNELEHTPGVVVLLHASVDHPKTVSTSGVCESCAEKPRSSLAEAIMARYQTSITDLRPFDIHPSSGRA